jgi:hypothetical protein
VDQKRCHPERLCRNQVDLIFEEVGEIVPAANKVLPDERGCLNRVAARSLGPAAGFSEGID